MKKQKIEKACFGAGCFWGAEYVFLQFKGILKTEAGYMGGDDKKYPKPSYEEVCTDLTGHAEVVYLEFNTSIISYRKLLEIFFKCHDPTQMNRQGHDTGSQYRSIIFYFNEEQKEKAEKAKKEYEKILGKKIATSIEPAGKFNFHPAEEYHQKYYEKTGKAPYCHIVPRIKI